MKKFIIYKIKNLVNNKIYIGKHETFDIEDGYMGSGLLLKRAYAKYGIESFQKEILEECENFDQMNTREKFWIKELKTTDPSIGYNIMEGGDGGDYFTNHPNKEELRKKFSSSQKGKIISDSTKKLISQANSGENNGMFGRKHSKEILEKIGKAAKNRVWKNESREKLSLSKKGMIFSDEHRKNLANNHKGFKGMKHSEESLEKMRKSKRGSSLNKKFECSLCGKKTSTLFNLNKHYNKCSKSTL